MYVIIRSVILLFLYSTINILGHGVQDPNQFGPYYINYTKLEMCLGPKTKNAAITTANLTFDGHHTYGHFNLTFLISTYVEEVKIMVYSTKNGNTKSLLWTYRLNDLCKHFVFGSIIETRLNASNCYIKKGTYLLAMKFDEVTTSFFGPSFFYGEFLLKESVFSKKGNIMCLLIGMKICKKT